ncbi:MAG: SUMF1/EgtB/PvdO family nonheme iron enzyme [Taibaiella sp.]|nr:SUMF1/EgtB/PvdO family nonheme iron enzyme [Taibaiella sp.]
MKKILFSLALLSGLQPVFAEDKKAKDADKVILEMVAVAGGTFDMGADSEAVDRRPAHTVTLNNFNIGKYEVTEAQWMAVMGAFPSSYSYCDNCPITNVSFNDVQAFIEKLNAMSGKHYRLPTEAEWEFAARGGVKEHMRKDNSDELVGRKYSGKVVLQYIAWFERNAKDHVHAVGKKDPNKLGAFDMTGNVEEWVNDWYNKDYFSKKDITNPQGPEGGISKVVRGGSWRSEADEVSVTRRAAYLPKEKSISLGFRLAE